MTRCIFFKANLTILKRVYHFFTTKMRFYLFIWQPSPSTLFTSLSVNFSSLLTIPLLSDFLSPLLSTSKNFTHSTYSFVSFLLKISNLEMVVSAYREYTQEIIEYHISTLHYCYSHFVLSFIFFREKMQTVTIWKLSLPLLSKLSKGVSQICISFAESNRN